MKAILTADIFSHVKPKHQYGAKGEHVTIVVEYGHVAIVENNKNRFSVTIDKLLKN
jgi:hypothetical protein